jgi:hypothetical protein
VAQIFNWKILTQSLYWIFLKIIRIGFGAIEAANVNAAGIRQLVREIVRQVVRDF